MKNYATLFVLFFSVMIISAQEKTFNDVFQHKTGNNNGKDLTIEFTCVYFTYMNDPQYKERAKVISEGDFIMYNGKKYFKSDIGQEVFDKVKMGLVNIQFDIYQGSSRVSTVRRNNVGTSAGLVQSGYFWRTLWPGVSGENAKNIYKKGFTVKNVKIYDVKFNMYPLKDLLAKRKRAEETKVREEERLRVEAENKKIEEERLRIEAQKKEEERLRLEAEAKKKEEERLKQLEIENKRNESREERLEELKKEANRQAEILDKERKEELRLKKEAIDRNLELEKQRIEKESAENAAVRRRLAERRKEEEARKKREFEKSRKKVEKSLGNAFSSGISSLVDGGGSLKFVYGIRTIEGDQSLRSPLGASTLEIGAGFGRICISVGYSLVDNQDELNTDTNNRRERASGGTWAFGLDVTIFKFKFLNSDADFGINGEYGFGNLDFEVSSSSSDFNIEYATNFYGVGAQLKFLNYLFVSYGYGKFTTEETRISNSTSVLDPVDGFYTKLGFGVKYDFGY